MSIIFNIISQYKLFFIECNKQNYFDEYSKIWLTNIDAFLSLYIFVNYNNRNSFHLIINIQSILQLNIKSTRESRFIERTAGILWKKLIFKLLKFNIRHHFIGKSSVKECKKKKASFLLSRNGKQFFAKTQFYFAMHREYESNLYLENGNFVRKGKSIEIKIISNAKAGSK